MTIIPLYAGPQQVARQTSGGLSQSAPSEQRRVVEYLWQLEPLRLAPGMQVVFQAAASDYLPQTTRSEPRRLIVVTPLRLKTALPAGKICFYPNWSECLRCSVRAAGRSKPWKSAWMRQNCWNNPIWISFGG